MTNESRDIRVKRLRMRVWHRGTKEMDLLLGGWADRNLDTADDTAIDLFERVLEEQDHDLYQWISGQRQAPDYMADFAAGLASEAVSRLGR